MTHAPNRPMLGPVTDGEFRNALMELGLSQAQFVRILRKLSDENVAVQTVNRWAKGRRAVPPLAAAVLRLLRMLPTSELQKLKE